MMLPRQRAFNTRKQQSSRGGKYDNGVSPSKMKKKLMKIDEDSKGYGKYNKGIGKGNFSRVNSGDGPEKGRDKNTNSRSRGKGDKRKKSMDKKSSRGNLMGKNKKSKKSLSQNKKSRVGSQNKRKKQKQEAYYKVRL